MKKTILSITLLAAALSGNAFAMGPAPQGRGSTDERAVQRLEAIQRIIEKYNAQVSIEGLPFRAYVGRTCLNVPYDEMRDCAGSNYESLRTHFASEEQKIISSQKRSLCLEVAAVVSEVSCDDLVSVQAVQRSWKNNYDRDTWTPVITLRFSIAQEAEKKLQDQTRFDSSNRTISYNVQAIYQALRDLRMLPRQRKAIEGFWGAAASFVEALKTEEAKAAKNEKFKPVTHRDFVAQANLLLAYYRYLREDLQELAQLSSDSSGRESVNQRAVDTIEKAIGNLVDAYGLDTDVVAKQAADYGRVFVDLMNNFSQQLTQSEKDAYTKPLIIHVGSKIIPASEAYGDVGTRDAVIQFQALWEAEAFQNFLREKLSASDDRINSLILNISNLAYKIGLAANVDIRVLDAKDVERLKNQKPRS